MSEIPMWPLRRARVGFARSLRTARSAPPGGAPLDRPRFYIRTYGCQMNVHDTEKLANLLCHGGWAESSDPEASDLLVINTCSIREKAENRLYSDLGTLRAWKQEAPGRVLAVGGCVAQQEGDVLLRRFAHLDIAFGTHNLRLVPQMVASARQGQRAADTRETRSLERFDLPERHPALADRSPGRAFVTVMEGCDMFCSFCIVPTTRGREISRPADAIVLEVEALAARGVREVTLLGQTVNAYGRHDQRRGRSEAAGTVPFAALLERLAGIRGLARIRYTSPHPIFFDAALVAAHRDLEALCPHVHLPAQSGSDRILERMRRRYVAADLVRLAGSLRDARPDIAITTDLIVGFPGESDADFQDTLRMVAEVGFVDSYSFKYSPRPGTAAAELGGEVAPEVAQERLEALQAQQRSQTLAYHRSRVGSTTSVLLEGPSRAGGHQAMGRDLQHRVVNLELAAGAASAGALLDVELLEATPHSLIGRPLSPAGLVPSIVKKTGHLAEEQGRTRNRASAVEPGQGG